MAEIKAPTGLGTRGKRLWEDLTEEHDLDAMQSLLLGEACRTADRLEKLDALLRGEVDTWACLVHDLRTEYYELKIDGALAEARQQQNVLKQLLTSLRLPDEATGKRPQRRAARGAYAKAGGAVSSLERARAARSS